MPTIRRTTVTSESKNNDSIDRLGQVTAWPSVCLPAPPVDRRALVRTWSSRFRGVAILPRGHELTKWGLHSELRRPRNAVQKLRFHRELLLISRAWPYGKWTRPTTDGKTHLQKPGLRNPPRNGGPDPGSPQGTLKLPLIFSCLDY